MVYRSVSTTHLNSNDVNNVLPITTINCKSSSFTNLTLPPPQIPDFDPGKQARRSVRRLSIDIERLRLKKDVTTSCTTKRRNSVCRSVCDLSKTGSYDDLKSLKPRRNECVQKQRSDKIAVPCTTTTKLTIPPFNDAPSNSLQNPSAWLSEGLEPEPELEEKKVNSFPCSLNLDRLPVNVVDFLISMKSNIVNDKSKILCLYCDRTFSSQTLHAKHTERVHQAPEGRRLSARKSNSSSLLYPGCSHCHNGKTTSLLNDELPALFDHLIDIHFDKYFACKPCTIRFTSKETLQVHLEQLHKDIKTSSSTNVTHDKRKKRSERRDKHAVSDNDATDVSQPLSIQVDLEENDGDKKDEEKSSSDEPFLRSSRRQLANRIELLKTASPRKTRMLRNEEMILSRLGIAQNRSPRTRRVVKAEIARAETPIIRSNRNRSGRQTNNSSGAVVEGIEVITRATGVTKIESLSSTFDENFYESVNSNVRQNLSCHLDGKLQSGPMSPSPISPVDPVPTVRSTLVKSPLIADSEIHEATAISALTAFPTLLTASQYGAEPMPIGKIKKPITKNSWKWKWDSVKKYKYVNEGGKIVKKVKQPIAGIRDLSKLDMWTQLTMRTKHESVRKQEIEISGEDENLAVGEAAREDKRKLIEQLNRILDARILPQINLEQNDQRVVKLEVTECQSDAENQPTEMKPELDDSADYLPTLLQLKRRPPPNVLNEEERVLSGEWARPRCYICYGCGEKFDNIRRLEDHKSTYHPHVYSTHYEIVGKELMEGDLFRHFYIPKAALRHSEYSQRTNTNAERKGNIEVEDSMDSVTSFSASFSKCDSFDIDSNSRNSKVSVTSTSSSVVSVESLVNDVTGVLKKSCTKCKRSYNTTTDLYRHMLDCSGDYDWFLAKKRHNIKYRYYGSRRRRIHRPNFGNRRIIRPKKEESDTPRTRDAYTPKPRPSDAESIQRMLANLPAKRVCRQIFPNLQAKKRARKFMPANTLGRNRQGNTKSNRNFKFIATTQTTANAIKKNISRRLRFFSSNNGEMGRSTRSAKISKKTDTQTPPVANDVTSPKCRGVGKNIGRRAQRVFPKLVNSFRRPLQKRSSNAKKGSPKAAPKETKSTSIMDRINFRKSKRVQVTLTKLEDDIVDKAKFEEKKNIKNIEEQGDSVEIAEPKKASVKKRSFKKLIKGIRGKRTGNKNSNEKIESVGPAELPTNAEEEAAEQNNKVQEKIDVQPIQIDESSQSSNRSNSSKRTKRGSMKNQKLAEENQNEHEISITAEATIEIPSTPLKIDTEVSTIQQEDDKSTVPPDEPMDLSQPTTKLEAPIVQEPIKTPLTKRRTRKLNDCIAMLTGKLQEKLGVPFLSNETNILLSPSISNENQRSENNSIEVFVNSKDDVDVTLIDSEKTETPTKEQNSNHSTPTKRGNRKGRSINVENDTPNSNEEEANNVTLEALNENANVTLPNNVNNQIEESVQLNDVAHKVTTEIIKSSDGDCKSSLDVSNELTDAVLDSKLTNENLSKLPEDSLVSENASSLERTPKRGSKPRNTKSANLEKPVKLSSPNKEAGSNDKIQTTEKNVDKEVKIDSSPEIPDQPIPQLATKPFKRKESKNKLMPEVIISLDTIKPLKVETSSIKIDVPKKRQTKNSTSTLPSEDNAVMDDPESLVISDKTNEVINVPEEPQKMTTKTKRRKGIVSLQNGVDQTRKTKKFVKSVRKKVSKDSSLDSAQTEEIQDETKSLKNEEKSHEDQLETVVDEKKIGKSSKSSKTSKIPDFAATKSDELTKPTKKPNTKKHVDLSDEDEMHPWDPEVGFVYPKNVDVIPSPVPESTAVTDGPDLDNAESSLQSNLPTEENLSAKKTNDKSSIKKKRRKNELAKIIADQLLESFKEVDKSRIEELKLLHDLSIESNDDLLITSTLSRTPPPKRRTAVNIRTDALVDLDTSFEETNSSEDIEVGVKTTTSAKRKKTAVVDSKKVANNVKLVTRRKIGAQKGNKKDCRKKVNNVESSGYLSDSEICQAKEPVNMRRRLTICNESPKRMSRNSKETEISISLFDSIKKPRNVNDAKQPTSMEVKFKVPTKERKRKNRRNILPQVNVEQPTDDKNTIQNDTDESNSIKISSEKFDDNGKEKTAVNDLVAQIINDFTTSTLNSPTTSPIVFGEVMKPSIGLNNAATKLSNVLINKKNILNGEILSNGFKNDVSKEITFATLSQPLKNKSIEQIRNSDTASGPKSAPFRAPFMSPRWEQADEVFNLSKPSEMPLKDPTIHKLWTLNNKDEKLSDKSLYQNVKDKAKKLLGKISKKKVRKHDSVLLNNKLTISSAVGLKRPLLRPSILSVSNLTTSMDVVDSENCLKKLESNSFFLGKVSNFENDSISKIFVNEKTIPAVEKNKVADVMTENELFDKNNDAIQDNVKLSIEKSIELNEIVDKQPRKNIKKGRLAKNSKRFAVSKDIADKFAEAGSSKLEDSPAKLLNDKEERKSDDIPMEVNIDTTLIVDNVNAEELKMSVDITEVAAVEPKEGAKIVQECIGKTKTNNGMKGRKMGSLKRKSKKAILVEKSTNTTNSSNNLNEAFCESDDYPVTPSRTKSIAREKPIVSKSFDPCNDSSQKAINSEIVNKICEAYSDQVTESDEDLSLAEIAKNLNNKILNCDEYNNEGIAVPLESFADKTNFNALVSVINEQLEPKINEINEESVICDDTLQQHPAAEPTKDHNDVDDNGLANDNTNTELIDMDLEDTASVYTSSMETTVTSSGGSQKRQRKRRHGRSILMKSNRKTKRNEGGFLTPGESYFCDICSKTFSTQGGLATHRTTLTHISKLSEQEFKSKMEPPKDIETEPKPPNEEDAATKPDITKSPIIESSSQPYIPLNLSPPSSQRNMPVVSPIRNQSMTYLNNIEPISSPEQHDLNYDRYNSITSRSRNHLPMHENSSLALSQEQRFFYECCSMLKGSDRSNINPSDSPGKYYTLPQRSEVITKPVTPRSNEQYSYVVPEGSKHSKGIPKIDLNQFSDISSDSNPAYSCPQNPSSSETQNIFPIESKTITDKNYHTMEMNNYELMKKDGQIFDNGTTTIENREYLETYSDMGDSFPSSHDVSESEQYVQTILERSSNGMSVSDGGYHQNYNAAYSKNTEGHQKRTNLLTMAMENHETKGFPNSSPVESPLHSTSSQSSTLSKPRTKAAMKGYDNFKVSIPTTGLDLQQALNRSPNPSGCKLAALADIALGNDVPNSISLIQSASVVGVEPAQTEIFNKGPEPVVVEETPVAKSPVTNKSTGNKLGFNHRKNKTVTPKSVKKSNKSMAKLQPKSPTKTQPRDIYDFEDFDDSVDAPILTLSQVRSKPIPSTNYDEVSSEISSYSDREDYNYESMSESDTSVNNLQKKCLIEHIFKSVKKTDAKPKNEPKKSIPKQELDKLFDGLRHGEKTAKVEERKSEEVSTVKKEKSERANDRQSKKPREIANLEEEWGMSMNEIAELIGVGQRKTQRRCAVNKQKTFAENWSSDEYEDFHATKDIFALIHEAEMKAGRARNRTARNNAKRESQQQDLNAVNKNEDVANDGKQKCAAATKGNVKDKENKLQDKKDATVKIDDSEANESKSEPPKRSHSKTTNPKKSLTKPAKAKKSKSFGEVKSEDSDEEFKVKRNAYTTKVSKIRNRRQTISSRHEIQKSAKSITNGVRVKQNRSVDSRGVKSDSKSKSKPMARRKRKASEMLYYWSSSSDEEFGRIKPRDDNFDDDNLEQHGWIVGDSHKKLVTLLAHAKGKKIDDCAVKEAVHKKKS